MKGFNIGGAILFLVLSISAVIAGFSGGSNGSGNVNSTGTPAAPNQAQWTDATHVKGVAQGVFNVRTMYGAVPDGSTDNGPTALGGNNSIANAFAASNAFTQGIPTIYFDCPGPTKCQYNYSGTGISSINPTIATTIECEPGVTLNYTGTAHAADIGPAGLVLATFQGSKYTISKGCRWTGGGSYTAGMYINTYILSPVIEDTEFFNFGNQTGYTIVYAGNNWMPLVSRTLWRDTDGFTKNMIDGHVATNSTLDFADNKSECTTSVGAACSVATTGIGLWVWSVNVHDSEIKYHYPAIRISSCAACGGGTQFQVRTSLLEGNANGPAPAITFGDPGTAGSHINFNATFDGNTFYWPVVANVPIIGPETASSGSFNLDNGTLINNSFTTAPSGTAVYVNTNQGSNWYVSNNKGVGVLLNQASTPPIIDTGFATQKAYFGLDVNTGSGGALANSLVAFDGNGIHNNRASFHNVSLPRTCSDVSGSATTQTCNTSPKFDLTGAAIGPSIGDEIIYTTTTANSGALTINENGTGAAPVKKFAGTTALANGDIQANLPYSLTYDGTNWELPVYLGPLGTIPIANGGTGQITAGAAFNALSPMTTAGDIIYGGAAGAATRLAAGTSSQVLIGSATVPSWGAVNLASMVTGSLPLGSISGFGAGVATALGNATNAASGLPTVTGSIVNNNCLKWSTSTGIVDAGGTCTTGGGGGTVNSGTQWQSTYYALTGTAVSGEANVLDYDTGNEEILGSNWLLAWSTGNSPATTTVDTFIQRGAAANIKFGAADAAAPVAQTLSVQNVVAGTSNTAGANTVIAGSQGTGTGIGGAVIFQESAAGSTGTAQNALTEVARINPTGTNGSVNTLGMISLKDGGGHQIGLTAYSNDDVLIGTTANNFARFSQFSAGQPSNLTTFELTNTGEIAWASAGGPTNSVDTMFRRAAAATIAFGDTDASTAIAQALQVQSVVAGTSNTAGKDWIFNGSKGTGTGAGGNIVFKTAPAGTTGTAQNALATAFTIDQAGHLRTGGSAPTCGTGCASVAGNDTAMVVTTGSAVTSIAVNFNQTWNAAPTCVANGDASTGFVYIGTPPSTTVLTLNSSVAFTSDKIYVHCLQ